jgi:lysophospholipase L1-like esterase
MSRGGLIVYRWASAHPDCTAGIYADNPVCDFRSWPGGAGASPQREAEWQECLRAYGIGAAEANTVPQPIDLLAPLAKAAVPLLHVVGAADTVVPVAENTDIVEQRYRALGGSIEVIRKPGQDHHPHSLPDPQPIVDFALRATGRNIVFAALAQPGVEWRAQAAGWGAGSWRDQHEAIVALGAAHPDLRIVCLGDSITQGLTGVQDRLSRKGGERAFDRAFGDGAAGFGISGDRTEHVLWRIQHGEFGSIDPAVIVLTIGVNNLSRGDRGADVALGIEAIVRTLRTQEPQAKLLLLGCLPAGAAASRLRQQRAILQRDIVHLDDGAHVLVRDFDAAFVQPDGSLHPDRVAGDGIHLTKAGQDAWLAALQPLVERLLAR